MVPEFETKNEELMFFKEMEFWEIGDFYKPKKKSPQKPKLDVLDEYISPYAKPKYSMAPSLTGKRRQQVDSMSRLTGGKKGSVDIFSTPNLLSPGNKTAGSPRKSLRDKQQELKALMSEEPKKKSSTGYVISDDLRTKWKKLGPLTMDMIEKHLNDWADINA